MKRAMLLAAVLLLGCPGPDGKVDPYLTAHTVINQVSLALPIAQGIFNQWALMQTDQAKVKAAEQTFAKVSTAVANGLKIAHDGVDIAKAAKETPDVTKLLAQADMAWKDLYKFLDGLLAKGADGITVALAEGAPPPASQPAGEVAVKRSAVKVNKSPMTYLPQTLVPKQ